MTLFRKTNDILELRIDGCVGNICDSKHVGIEVLEGYTTAWLHDLKLTLIELCFPQELTEGYVVDQGDGSDSLKSKTTEEINNLVSKWTCKLAKKCQQKQSMLNDKDDDTAADTNNGMKTPAHNLTDEF